MSRYLDFSVDQSHYYFVDSQSLPIITTFLSLRDGVTDKLQLFN